MPPKSKPSSDLGSIEQTGPGTFRAHIQHRSAAGKYVHAVGPKRTSRTRAEIDLEQIRLSSTAGKTREEGLEIMAAEARRIQISAQFEAEAEMQRQREATCGAPFEFFSDDEDEPWLMDYPPPGEEEAPPPVSQQGPLTPEEANEALRKFRPIWSTPAALEHILACRANPNPPLAEGDISPLRKVIAFASGQHVAKMRELLLEHGAEETEEDRERWRICEKAWLCENIRLREARDLDSHD